MHPSLRTEEIIKDNYKIDLDDDSIEIICSSYGDGAIIYLTGKHKNGTYHIVHFEEIQEDSPCVLECNSIFWDIKKKIYERSRRS